MNFSVLWVSATCFILLLSSVPQAEDTTVCPTMWALEEHLGCFPFGTSMNKVATSIRTQVCGATDVFVFLGQMPRSARALSYGALPLDFYRKRSTASPWHEGWLFEVVVKWSDYQIQTMTVCKKMLHCGISRACVPSGCQRCLSPSGPRNIKITDRQLANESILEMKGTAQHGESGQHVFKTSQLLRDWMLVVLTIKKEIIIMHQETTNQHVIHLRLSPMLYVHYIPTHN